MRPVLFFSLFSLFLFTCKSQVFTVDNLPKKQLVFGHGGGMTGEVNTYTLLENGQIFHGNSLTKEHNEIKSINRKRAETCFKKMEALKLSEMNFQHPGNLYYFLEEVNGPERNRVTWGSNDYDVSKQCTDFYKELRTTIK